MHFYPDYLTFLEEHDLMLPSLKRAVMPGVAQFICHLCDCRHFKRILEIGRCQGHSFGLFRWLSPESLVVSIDPEPSKTAKKIANLFEGPYQFINKTSDAAFADGIGQDFDLVLIDGNHKLAFARRDWKNALKIVSPNAIVIFDDLGHKAGCGEAFHEIKIGGQIAHKFEQREDHITRPKKHRIGGNYGVVIFR